MNTELIFCNLVPEIHFVLLCACVAPDDARINRINDAAANLSMNWELVYKIAFHQRVVPLLYKNFKTIPDTGISEKTVKKFKDAYFNNTLRNFYFTLLLLKLLQLLKKNGIPAVPFKGPVLARDIYGDLGLRQFSDLDILVASKDVSAAWKIFLKNGLKPKLALKNGQIKKYIRSEDNMEFFSKAAGARVELHWELSGIYLSKPLLLEDIENRLTLVQLHKKQVFNLSSEEYF